MNHYWGYSDDMLDQGYKALRKGVFLFGAFFTLLGILIFMFPKLIAFIVAFFILVTGISGLMLGYRIWKLQNRVRPIEWKNEAMNTDIEVENPRGFQRTITFIMR